MFPAGAVLMFIGYALIYTGVANLLNGGNGPTFGESLGIQGGALAPPGADKPQRFQLIPGGETKAKASGQTGEQIIRGGGAA